jgi:hypothetical protein
LQHKKWIGRTSAIAAKAVTVEQYRKFAAGYGIRDTEQFARNRRQPSDPHELVSNASGKVLYPHRNETSCRSDPGLIGRINIVEDYLVGIGALGEKFFFNRFHILAAGQNARPVQAPRYMLPFEWYQLFRGKPVSILVKGS